MTYSFIIIGKNEGFKITKSISSIINIKKASLIDIVDVIYIDSDSSDDTIIRAKKFGITIYQIKGQVNSAIARNVGAQHAKGDYLVFVDGDMELEIDFFKDSNKLLNYNFFSGEVLDLLYNNNWNLIAERMRHNKTRNSKTKKRFNEVGGLFIINEKIWRKIGGMDIRFKRSQDLDFGLTAAHKGIILKRFNTLLARHHTVSYAEKSRILDVVKTGYFLYWGILFRKHLFYCETYNFIFRNFYTTFILLMTIFLNIVFPSLYFLFVFYIISVLYKTINKKNATKINFLGIVFNMIRDIQFIFGFLFFFPKKPQYTIKKIN
jgi:glycosyltransferase involved in cell wall biosynthesis